MKTVCFFSGDITRGGGTEKAASLIANSLFEEGNYRIIFLSLTEQSSSPFFKVNDGIERFYLNDKWINPGAGYLKMIPRLRKFLKEQNVDIIVDIDIVLDSLSIPAAKKTGTKVVSWEHFNYEYENFSWYRRRILKYSSKRSDYVITLTNRDKKSYAENLGRTENISAVYNPIEELSGRYDLPKENLIITAGHLIKIKGVDYLADVAKRVLNDNPDWKWAVLGDGEEMPFLKEFANKNNLENKLLLPGRVSDMSSYLSKAQIYVMTSRLEGFGLSLLEGLAYSLPAVSFNIPTGPDEIIDDGVNGFLIPPFDCALMAEKINSLIRDDGLRKKFSEHTQDNIEKFKMKTITDEWNKILASLSQKQEG